MPSIPIIVKEKVLILHIKIQCRFTRHCEIYYFSSYRFDYVANMTSLGLYTVAYNSCYLYYFRIFKSHYSNPLILKNCSSFCIISHNANSSSLCISAQSTTYFDCLLGNDPANNLPSRSNEALILSILHMKMWSVMSFIITKIHSNNYPINDNIVGINGSPIMNINSSINIKVLHEIC